MKNIENICMHPGCDEPINCRGHCKTHYMVAFRMVERGDTTWAELEEAGKVKPAGKVKKSEKFFRRGLKSKTKHIRE